MKVEDFLKQNKIEQEIDAVYPIKKIRIDEDSVLLYLEDEKIRISDEAYFSYGIKNLKGLDEELYQKLKDDETLFKAYKSCLRKLSMKDHTVKQIRDFLSLKQLKKEDCASIIAKLESYGLLDDEKFCISKIDYYANTSLSAKKIRQKLLQAGVSEQLISKHLKSDEKAEYDKVLALAEKYDRSIRNKSLAMKKQAIISKLVAAGFSYELVNRAVQSLGVRSENELELLKREYDKAFVRYAKKYEGHDLKQRVLASLMQKGFDYDEIKELLEEENGKES